MTEDDSMEKLFDFADEAAGQMIELPAMASYILLRMAREMTASRRQELCDNIRGDELNAVEQKALRALTAAIAAGTYR